jgi:hypothetical protein
VGNSDYLTAVHLTGLSPDARGALEADIASEVGRMADGMDDFQYMVTVAWRLLTQWPSLEFDIPDLLDTGIRTLGCVRTRLGWTPCASLPNTPCWPAG